ncbi:hypothetical protein SAMN04488542_103106 [Fontibacillus panacisegetis]|uniref:Uncharacterized protein n=1 Tax=Fontibacillus panacisegetis TaxID=670482 RepID=A0A1G7GLA4_9BACL|nr:hypothetical protein [Fontibacillus panacisegetis]SDE88906.1 hypothetical protein SAMN04488542_103106 [Fontibacillus panacisegetis]
MEQLLPHIQLQKQSISDFKGLNEDVATDPDPTDHFVVYSGNHILYGLRGWFENNVEVIVDGNVLINPGGSHSQSQTVESILDEGVILLELESSYRAFTEQDRNGNTVKIVFVKS